MALLVGLLAGLFGLWFETVVAWDLMSRVDWRPVTLPQLLVINCIVSMFARGSSFNKHEDDPVQLLKRMGMWVVLPGLVWVCGMILLRFWLWAI